MTHLERHPPLTMGQIPRWPQTSVIEAFEGYYPEGFFDGFRFPFIEDIINTSTFLSYADWKSEKGEALGL